jgi:hypothetical protein
MALQGALSEFSVAEVMQLLALQQKSGILVLNHGDGRAHAMFFERGRILAAADRRMESRHPFLRHLLENLHVNEEQVETVEDISKETGQDIFTVLLTTGLMGRDRLQEEMQRYAQRLVDDVVGWQDGTYEFSGDEKSLPHQGLTLKLNPEELVMESMRRTDELATLKGSLISAELVLAKAPNPPSQPLPRECMVVLSLVDGRSTVEEISRRSPMGDYLTYDAIAELLGRQMVLVMDASQAARLDRGRAWGFRLSPISVGLVFLPIVLSLCFGALVAPRLHTVDPTESWLPASVTQHRKEHRDQLRLEVHRLRRSIDR